MSETNKQLINRIVELETMLQRNDKVMKDMEKDIERHGQKIASNILSTVFTRSDQESLKSNTKTNKMDSGRYFICYCSKIEEWKSI